MKRVLSSLIVILLFPAFSASANEAPADATELVRSRYMNGIPYEIANQYGPEAVPPLVEMLFDPADANVGYRTAMVLGVIGDEAAVAALIRFIEQPSTGTLSPSQFKAKNSAVASLGYAIHKSGRAGAIDFLASHIDPASWNELSLGKSPFHETDDDRNEQLSQSVLMALGLGGGDPRAGALLQAAAKTESAREFLAENAALHAEAQGMHEQISSGGIEAYYAK